MVLKSINDSVSNNCNDKQKKWVEIESLSFFLVLENNRDSRF